MAVAINEEEVERVVHEKVASGEYGSEAEVLLAAIRSLQWQDQEVAAIEAGLEDVRASLDVARQQIEQGDVGKRDIEAVIVEARRRASSAN